MADYVAAEMVQTPWGNARELQTRRLPPGPGRSRKDAARNQRERLFAAMVACVASRGYRATTVADLVELAGVSRATFYEHFDDKSDCFRTAVKALLDVGVSSIRRRLEGESLPEERSKEAIAAVVRLCVDQPAAARMCLVESYAAGEAGLDPINEAFENACELAHEALREIPGRERTTPELARAVIGGLHWVLYKHLHEGREAALLDCLPNLWSWVHGFEPQGDLRQRRRRRGREGFPPPYAGRDVHERILRAFATVVATRGFPRATIAHISAEASISQATFYQHFADKEDALIAALDLSGAQLMAAVLPAARRAPDWPSALRRAIEGVCGFLAAEPAFARLRAFAAYTAGPEAIAHRDRHWSQIIEELIPNEVLEGPEPGRLAVEASTGAIYGLIYERARKDEVDELPTMAPFLTYLMLCPFLGAEEAADVARGGQRESLGQA